MKILLLLSFYGLFTIRATYAQSSGSNNVFKPDFGKQNQLYKVVTQNHGLLVKNHVKPLGPLPPPADTAEILENPTTSKIFFKPNFGKQKEIFKVSPNIGGLLVKKHLNALGPLPNKQLPLSFTAKEISVMEISNNTTDFETVLEHIPPEEYVDINFGDLIIEEFSNDTTNEIAELTTSIDYDEDWFTENLESEDLLPV
ncbi:uncharacterized protein LOC119614657 [Lucilia sericata]|uniref:uncharacterized protein LOC119614657 n=1 Tax=Lucilia sericata TaxID=13632 RepID=UPI0018A85334|nr:uncharacterized protein LOC119614657 [Lucilia sericata]